MRYHIPAIPHNKHVSDLALGESSREDPEKMALEHVFELPRVHTSEENCSRVGVVANFFELFYEISSDSASEA